MNRIKDFLTSTWDELKRVQWPAKNHAYRLTIYVVSASLVVGLFVSGFDYLFKELLVLLIKQ